MFPVSGVVSWSDLGYRTLTLLSCWWGKNTRKSIVPSFIPLSRHQYFSASQAKSSPNTITCFVLISHWPVITNNGDSEGPFLKQSYLARSDLVAARFLHRTIIRERRLCKWISGLLMGACACWGFNGRAIQWTIWWDERPRKGDVLFAGDWAREQDCWDRVFDCRKEVVGSNGSLLLGSVPLQHESWLFCVGFERGGIEIVLGSPWLIIQSVEKISKKLTNASSSIHDRGLCGHIKEVSVAKDHQGKRIGLKIIKALDSVAVSLSCYKTILDCSPENEPFYVKCRYYNSGVEMSHYYEEKDSYHRGWECHRPLGGGLGNCSRGLDWHLSSKARSRKCALFGRGRDTPCCFASISPLVRTQEGAAHVTHGHFAHCCNWLSIFSTTESTVGRYAVFIGLRPL